MIDNVKVGKTIAALRQDRGMTQQQLAAALSVSHQAVSKWETGAALPDIQTMLSLTQLFGITVEQLVEGMGEEPEDSRKEKTLDDHFQNIGNFVSDVVDGIFHTGGEKAPDETCEEPVHAPEDESVSPQFSENNASEGESEGNFDVQKLLKMAPFMSREALDGILLENRQKLTPDDISRFAPFISRETLEKLIQSSEGEINWETLQRIAPFLKREAVDALARAAARGEKLVRRMVKKTERSASDFETSIEDVSQKIGAGMGKVARHAKKLGEDLVDGLSAAFGEWDNGPKAPNPAISRAQRLRMAAMNRALNDGNWEWIEGHIEDVQDADMRKKIADAAMAQGMDEWVREHFPEWISASDGETALQNEDWDGVSRALSDAQMEFKQRAALKAASDGQWNWLLKHIDQIDLGDDAGEIARMAYAAGQKEMAMAIVEHRMQTPEIEAFLNELAEQENYEWIGQLSHCVDSDFLEGICRRLAEQEKWENTREILPMVDVAGIERLMELAIDQGNFEAIDLLDNYLDD